MMTVAGEEAVCTLLVPNLLYVGSERNAANRELLIERNISAIVNAAAPQTVNHFQHEPSCYRYHSIDLLDAAEEDMLQHIEPHNRFLEEAERQGRVVLVHCKSGNSRAAALCIAYLMRRHRWPLAKAFAFVKMQRPAVQPNSGFLDQLAIYQERLQEEEERARCEEDDAEEDDEEEDPMETELARRRAAFMQRYVGGDDTEDDSDEGPGEEYAMDLDEDDDTAAAALDKGNAGERMNANDEQERQAEEEDEDEDEEQEEQREASRRAKAKRDWQRWLAKPPTLVDLIVRQRKAALALHLRSLFAARNWQELERVYAALRATPDFVNIVRAAYFAATKADAMASAAAIIAAQTTDGEATIEPVMEWRRTQQSRLETIFGTDPEAGFQRAFDQSLPYFLNPLAKTIVAHIDRTLRNASERTPKDVEDELLPLLESSLPYMGRSAAAFDYHYANALAGRLLSVGPGQNHRFHVERQVAQLVGRFPSFSGFGGLMEAMVSDAQFSFEVEEMQKSAAKEKASLAPFISLRHVRRGDEDAQPLVSVRLLAADLWPRRRIVPSTSTKHLTDADMRSWRGVPLASWPRSYVLPGQVQQKWDAFAAAYVAENPQKRVQYVPHMGTAEVQVVLGESRFFFTVTTPMMCVLHRLAFGHEFSLQELQDETGIPDKELKRTLFSLISPLQGSRTGLLLKRPAKGKFEPTDVFSVNASFASRLRKIRVPALPYPPPRKQRQSSSASTSTAAVAAGSSM